MIDTYWPLILPSFFGGGAFNIFLLRQFFLGIPKDLDEAARIDGAGPLQIFFRIIMPLAKSALVVVALFTFLGNWNDFFGPIIYLNTKTKFTLAVGLRATFSGNIPAGKTGELCGQHDYRRFLEDRAGSLPESDRQCGL